jgi:hypothetical protein
VPVFGTTAWLEGDVDNEPKERPHYSWADVLLHSLPVIVLAGLVAVIVWIIVSGAATRS